MIASSVYKKAKMFSTIHMIFEYNSGSPYHVIAIQIVLSKMSTVIPSSNTLLTAI